MASASYVTPAEELTDLLGIFGQVYTKPERYSHKVDLSFVSPRATAVERRRIRKIRQGVASVRKYTAAGIVERLVGLKFRPQLCAVLAQYIQFAPKFMELDFSPNSDEKSGGIKSKKENEVVPDRTFSDFKNDGRGVSLVITFFARNLAWLCCKGYDITDLATWEWILTGKSMEEAAARLKVVANHFDSKLGAFKPIPTFVLLLLVRRQDASSRGLRILLDHAWDRLLNQRGSKWGLQRAEKLSWAPTSSRTTASRRVSYEKLTEFATMILVIRLLRQARVVWPEAMVSIAKLMTTFVPGNSTVDLSPDGRPLMEQTSARLTFLYNKILSLLALPSRLRPFNSVIHHQRAQFIVLKRMSEFQPSLIVTREGYRAITAVQLAHKKTQRERQWAKMKAVSWPPWKEEKLGIDRDIGPEYGRSRASESSLRAREAGYSPQAWEVAAEVLAGWDTDGSPTIQTRAIFKPDACYDEPLRTDAAAASSKEYNRVLWAARVRATRTVDESWACFLAYKSQKDYRPSSTVYYAMFERLAATAETGKHILPDYGEKTIDNANSGTSNPLPGDGKETFPIPNPREAIYIRTPTPTFDELFEMMVQDRIKPSGRLLGCLWKHAANLELGIKYLKASSLPLSVIQALLGQEATQPEEIRAELNFMSDHLFADFICLLCRFVPFISEAHKIGLDKIREIPLTTDLSAKWWKIRKNPLPRALQLMEIRKPYYLPAWYWLLSALCFPGRVVTSFHTRDFNVQGLLTWKATCYLLQKMQEIGLNIDFRGFRILCIGLTKAIRASREILHADKVSVDNTDYRRPLIEDNEQSNNTKLDAEQILSTGAELAKKHFKRIVGTELTSRHWSPEASELLQEQSPAMPSAELPRLLQTPYPAELHVFIRLLGFCEDYVGLLDLVQWMSCYAPELEAAANEPINGKRRFINCMIGLRAFLERSWLFVDCEEKHREEEPNEHRAGEGVPQEIYDQIFAIVEKNKAWGGWPTDEQVIAYCREGLGSSY